MVEAEEEGEADGDSVRDKRYIVRGREGRYLKYRPPPPPRYDYEYDMPQGRYGNPCFSPSDYDHLRWGKRK